MSSVFTDPITGATSISGSLTVDNINIRGLSLGSTTLSSNAIWLPSTSLQWTPVVAPNLPTFSIPNGGTMTYSRRNGVYRWIGNDVSYNINVAGLLNTQSTVTTGDYTLNVPYPINVAAYGANALIGELWLTTYYQANSNSFKAYARTIAADANNVTIRVLTGTADVTLTTALSNTTMILQGTMTYNTSSFNQVGGVPAAYLPAAFYQNAAGQVLLNSNVVGGVVAPRGQLDIVYNSNLPALVVDQLGTGDALQVRTGGVTKMVVGADGNVGIGTGVPLASLHVANGSFYSPGSVVQCVTTLYTARTTYSIPTTITPTEMTVLNVTIAPKRPNSRILLQWMINGEVENNVVFLVYRGSTPIGFNTESGDVQWSGVTAIPFDSDSNSTPANITVNWIDLPNTTNSITYSVRARSSNSTSVTLYLGRSVGSTGAFAWETVCSTGAAWEICV